MPELKDLDERQARALAAEAVPAVNTAAVFYATNVFVGFRAYWNEADGALYSFCASGYEITPIVSIDRFPLGTGRVGPVTQKLLNAYMSIVRGTAKRCREWRTPVYSIGGSGGAPRPR